MEPKSREEWKGLIDAVTTIWAEPLPQLRKVLRVRTVPQTVGGVKAFVITPDEVAPENRKRLLVHLHAGAYVALEGESRTGEGILMAHHGKITVISVDCRLALDHPFPAALEDAVAAWAGRFVRLKQTAGGGHRFAADSLTRPNSAP